MAPKKDVKKQVVVEQPVIEQPVIPPHELQGFGRFDYPNGVNYIGQWRLVNGIKTKHGEGTLTVPGQGFKGIGNELYKGNWFQDRMNGKGAYYYANGAVYQGQFKNNRHHGKGKYQFPNGTIYEGEWQNGLMHGTGLYIDASGRVWDGQFRNGIFQTKIQQQLGRLRKIELRKQSIKQQIGNTLNSITQAIAKSDKKTLKDNMAPFFVAGDVMKQFVKDPFSKVDQRPQEKWTQVINILKGARVNVLGSADQSQFLGAQRILGAQLKGAGQVVQIINVKDERTTKIALASPDGNAWNVILVQDQQKKK